MDYKVILATTPKLKEKVFQIRKEVFVEEQKVSQRDEFDAFEDVSRHFLAMDFDGNPIGAARWRSTQKGIKLERFAVKSSFRKKGIGSNLVQKVLEDIGEKIQKPTHIYLHAQLDAIPLYAKFGFEKKGELFFECNIAHYEMLQIVP